MRLHEREWLRLGAAAPALVFVGLAGSLAAVEEPLSWAEIESRARPSPELLAAEAALAAEELALAETTDRWSGAPSGELTAGPRWDEGSTRVDVAVELEVPLWKGAEARQDLRSALAQAARIWRLEAGAQSAAQLARAFLEAWTAQEKRALLGAELATLGRWLEVARRRVEAGADPPYEATLVEAEWTSALWEQARAEAGWVRAWGELRARADLPAEPQTLDSPAEPLAASDAELRQRFERGALARAPAARAFLAEKHGALEVLRRSSRWSLSTALAREGEEHVARAGVAVRWPFDAELPALERQVESAVTSARRQAEIEREALSARLEAALLLRNQLATAPPFTDVESALIAIELRLSEGKARPSEALPLVRQFLLARSSQLERRKAQFELAIELSLLTAEVSP